MKFGVTDLNIDIYILMLKLVMKSVCMVILGFGIYFWLRVFCMGNIVKSVSRKVLVLEGKGLKFGVTDLNIDIYILMS